MRYMKAKKLATGMLVAVLLLSSLAVLPSVTVKAASQSALVSFNVVDLNNGNAPVSGATATLTETHTSQKYTSNSDAGGLVSFTPVPGFYILKITKAGYYDLQFSQIVKVDGINPVQYGQIGIQQVPATTGVLSVTVTSGGNPVSGVTLKTIDITPGAPFKMEKTYTFNSATTQTVYTASYRLVTSAVGYETDVRDITVSGGTVNVNIALNAAVSLSGYAFKTSTAATNVNAVLVSSNLALPLEKRVIQARVISNYFVFDAFADPNFAFYLMVDATDAKTNMTAITLTTSTTLTVNLAAQSLQTDNNDAFFANGDWNNFKLTRNITMDFDGSWANIPYSFIPNLRMQIDFAFGNGDGQVDATEYAKFVSTVNSYGPVNATSSFIVRVNSTIYTVIGDMTSSFTGLSGSSVTSQAQYTGSMVSNYRSVSTLSNGGALYNVLGYAKYETNSMDYRLVITWPRTSAGVLNYEMTSNTTQTTYVSVSGYTTVTINTANRGTGTYEQVTMVVQRSVAPTATAGVGGPTAYTYTVTSGTKVLYYIVSTQRDIVFTANGSADANGNPLRFTWTFGDGGSTSTSSYWTTHNYSTASYNRTVTLTVTDVAQKTATQTFYVKCDGIIPEPKFIVKNKTISGNVLNVDQNEAVVFNAASSLDHIASNSASDIGVIRKWTYVWGDGNSTTIGVGENQNVTKTYAKAGTFTMWLNTTDGAGRINQSAPVTVVVKDKTPPTISYVITYKGNDTKGTAVENQTLVFSANATTDNFYPFDQLTFKWSFGDGTYYNGTGSAYAWTTHKYQKIATFSVNLTVSDPVSNTAYLVKSMVITSEPRPDLRLIVMTFNPTTFTEGSAGTITVNITNVGNAVAATPYVLFYYLNADGSKVQIGRGDQLYVNGSLVTELKVGQYGLISISWTPNTKGNYTILANAVTNGEINTVDNSITKSVTVNEAAWKAIALYGGIFAVIIVVIVLYYFRKRLPKVGGGKKSEKEEKPVEKGKGKK